MEDKIKKDVEKKDKKDKKESKAEQDMYDIFLTDVEASEDYEKDLDKDMKDYLGF